VVITTGLSNCWAALTQRSLHTNTSSSQQQQILQMQINIAVADLKAARSEDGLARGPRRTASS
jgi:hypothetical protein